MATLYTFDHVFPDTASQKDLYSSCVVPLVRACLKGYNATVFAYGQTGSGKTHTIVGPSIQHEISTSSSGESSFSTSLSSGMIPRAFQDLLFNLSKKKAELCNDSNDNSTSNTKKKTPPYEYEVRIQFLEIYGEEIRDLLAPSSSDTRLTIRDGAAGEEPEVIGASEVTVNTTKEALLCLQKGTLRRVTAATQMNSTSSRSHAMMSVTVEQRTLRKTSFTKKGSSSSNNGENANNSNNSNNSNKQNDDYDDRETEEEVKRSRFHFVDLAGSERQKRTKAEGQRLKEGIDINKGLLVLGNVISALGDSKKVGRTHVPYRDSKLTRLLKGSLGGNHKTLMIACVSPASVNMEESLNCLRYANRAKNIQNNAVVNLDAGSRLVANLRGKCKDLARELLRIRDLCKIDDMEQIVKNVEAGSSYSEKLLLDLASGKDIEIPRSALKALSLNDVKSVNTNGDDRVDYKSIETDLVHLLGNSPLNLDRKMLSEKIDYSSFSIDENKIDNNIAPTTSVDEYKDRVAKRKVELDLMRQSSMKAKEHLLLLREKHQSESTEEESSLLESSTESVEDKYFDSEDYTGTKQMKPKEGYILEMKNKNLEQSASDELTSNLITDAEPEKVHYDDTNEGLDKIQSSCLEHIIHKKDFVSDSIEDFTDARNDNENLAQNPELETSKDLPDTSTKNIIFDRNHDENTLYTDITFDHTETENKSVVSRDVYEEKVASYEKELALLRKTIRENELKLSFLSNSDSKLNEAKVKDNANDLRAAKGSLDLTPQASTNKENLKKKGKKNELKALARISDHPLSPCTNIPRDNPSNGKMQKSEKEKEKNKIRLKNKEKIERDLMVLSLYMSPLLDF